jgi:D-aminopeptidase
VPIVPQAILFDLLNGGDKNWGRHSPYRDMAYAACAAAAPNFRIGSAGAGYGATVTHGQGIMMGGLGSASLVTNEGITIGALAAVNAAGSATIGGTPYFWAAPLEMDGEFGGLGWPSPFPAAAHTPVLKGSIGQNTTLGIVATDAALTREELRRVAVMAQTGLARALYPVHTPLDGDIVFALSAGTKPLQDPIWDLARLGTLAANTLARAIARGVYCADVFQGEPAGPGSYTSLMHTAAGKP